jgi:outer membrane lipoprotein-sorting protein
VALLSARPQSWCALAAQALALTLALVVAAPAAALSERDRADISRVESYLNRIQSIRARFVQVAPNGGLAEGQFVMQRPGRLRFEYAPPSPILVVGDGRDLVFYDSRLDQVSRIAISMTPLKVLLAETIDFKGRVGVDRVERTPGVLRLVVLDRERPKDGAVTLVFSEAPLLLRQWLVKDPKGLVTSIYLSEMESNPALEPELFVFVDPNPDRDLHTR